MRPLTAISLLTIGALVAVGSSSPIHNTLPSSSSASPEPPSRGAAVPPSSSLVPVRPPSSSSSSASPAPQQTALLDFKDLDDQLVAVKRTKAFLSKLGYEAKFPTKDPNDGIWIKDEGIGFTILAFCDKDGLDRLVISCGMPGNGVGTLSDLAALEAINALNFKLNVGNFALNADGDLIFGTNLVFDDTLSARLFHQHIEHMKAFAAFFMTTKNPEFAKPRDLLIK